MTSLLNLTLGLSSRGPSGIEALGDDARQRSARVKEQRAIGEARLLSGKNGQDSRTQRLQLCGHSDSLADSVPGCFVLSTPSDSDRPRTLTLSSESGTQARL